MFSNGVNILPGKSFHSRAGIQKQLTRDFHPLSLLYYREREVLPPITAHVNTLVYPFQKINIDHGTLFVW